MNYLSVINRLESAVTGSRNLDADASVEEGVTGAKVKKVNR
jgi:hypothetical protein